MLVVGILQAQKSFERCLHLDPSNREVRKLRRSGHCVIHTATGLGRGPEMGTTPSQ